MTDTATPAPATSSLDAVLGKIDALLATGAPAPVTMTQPEFQAHVAGELEKAIAEQAAGKVETQKARLEHLKAQVAAAKAVFDTGATTVQLTPFKDPWQTMPGETASKGTVDVPQPAITPTGDSNVQFMQDVLVNTEKGRTLSPAVKALFSLAKAAPDSAIRKALVAKAGAEVAPAIIAKAGEAMAVLEKLAAVFGYTPEPGEGLLDCDFRWTVSDTISALQSAARTENVITQMSGLLGSTAAAKTAIDALPAPAPAPAPAAKSAGAAPAAPPPAPGISGGGVESWPTDMAAAVFDEKTGLMKAKGDEEGKLYWGRDSEHAPTT